MDRIPFPRNRYLIFAVLAVGGFVIDLATKSWVFARLGMPGATGERIRILGNVLVLETNLNEGALFGMGQGFQPIFIALALLAALGILVWLFWSGAAADLWLTIALGMITAGIFGNFWDRIGMPGLRWPEYTSRAGERIHAVRDWIHFEIEGWFDFPVFNIADSLLVIGVGILLLHTFLVGENRVATPAASPAGPN
jgi:signal peptidase II